MQRRHQAGHSLCWTSVCLEDRSLATAAKNAFGGWRAAIQEAGLGAELQRMDGKKSWDSQQVIDRIRKRQEEGKPLHYTAVNTDDSTLTSAARRYFGNWSNVLTAAGVDPQQHVCSRRRRQSGQQNPAESTESKST
jgi:hypothetical protein